MSNHGYHYWRIHNCAGTPSVYTWWFPYMSGLGTLSFGNSDQFYQMVGAPAVGTFLQHVGAGFLLTPLGQTRVNDPNTILCMEYMGVVTNVEWSATWVSQVWTTVVRKDYGSSYLNDHGGQIVNSISLCCAPVVSIGVGPDDPILTSLPAKPPKPPTGLPGQVYSPCDPTPTILNDPEFCRNCQPGGYYAANGGWGGTMNHPSCQCCPSSPSSPDRPGSGDSLPKKMPPPKPLPSPPSNCPMDVVIGIDFSGSMGDYLGWPGIWGDANDFVRDFVTGLDTHMDGSIGGVAGSGSSDVQVGTYLWNQNHLGPQTPYNPNIVVRNMTNASQLIVDDTNIPNQPGSPGIILGNQVIPGAWDDYDAAVGMGMIMLNNFGGSVLGNRSSQPNYRRIMIIVTDGLNPYFCNQMTTNMANTVWNVGTNAGTPELDVEVYALCVHGTTPSPNIPGSTIPPVNWPLNAYCLVGFTGAQATNVYNGNGAVLGVLGASLASTLCVPYNPCTDPTNSSYNIIWNQIPYGYRTSWYHEPGNLNMAFTGTVTLPGPFPLAQPPYPSTGSPSYWQPNISTFTLSQLNALISVSNSIVGPWTHSTTGITYPSRIRMENPTANIDYANQSSICEWCVDWQAGGVPGNMTGSVPGTFDNRVLNWPIFIANGWGLSEAEAMCDCCPAIDPGFALWSFPPEVGGVIGEWTGY